MKQTGKVIAGVVIAAGAAARAAEEAERQARAEGYGDAGLKKAFEE